MRFPDETNVVRPAFPMESGGFLLDAGIQSARMTLAVELGDERTTEDAFWKHVTAMQFAWRAANIARRHAQGLRARGAA
jgi:hypothetical protein